MKTFALLIVMFFIGALPVTASDRFITKIKLPTGQVAVVSEGEFEARSVGSFSVRLYQAASAGDETTFFSSGLIHARDGGGPGHGLPGHHARRGAREARG